MVIKQPLFRFDKDPNDYQWMDPFIGNNFNFFQNSEQLGRHVLSDRQDVLPTAFQYWSHEGITPKFLAKF